MNGRNLIGRLLLVLGLVVGPWPSAIASTAPVVPPSAAIAPLDSEAPCPAHAQEAEVAEAAPAASSCPCCGDGEACSGVPCVLSTPAPGLPIGAIALVLAAERVAREAAPPPAPPAPRPGEPLRPPIV